MKKQILFLAILVAISLACRAARAEAKRPLQIETDVVYGHKDGLALTMDVYRPEAEANGAAISSWSAAVGTRAGRLRKTPSPCFSRIWTRATRCWPSATVAAHGIPFQKLLPT